jgi:hypothetical protein
MTDRTSAGLFGRLFETLAANLAVQPPAVRDERKRLAAKFLAMARDYDFSRCDMDADDELRALGLPRPDDES